MRAKRYLIRMVGIAGGAAVLLGVTALPAMAVEQTLRIGNIKYGHGGVIRDGYRLYACDDRRDGDGVRTEVVLNNELTDYVIDENGSRAGCSYKNTPGQFYATRYRVCVPNLCTAWARAF